MVLMRDEHRLKVSSHTQSTISLSRGEMVYILELSNAQPMAQARDPCLQILACALTSLFGRTRRVDWRSPTARADSLLVGAAKGARGRRSLEKKRCGSQTL